MPRLRPTLLCRCLTALIGSDQYHACAHLRSTVPIQCCSMPLLNCDTHRNSQAPRLDALLCRSYTCPCQCSATPLVCYSMPKPSAPLLCHSVACLRNAFASHISALPSLHIAQPNPCSAQPGPFIAIQCLYFTIPVLTSRCSASAIRFLSLPQRNVTYPRLYSAYLRSAIALPYSAIA